MSALEPHSQEVDPPPPSEGSVHPSGVLSSIHHGILDTRQGAILIACGFAAVVIAVALRHTFLNDEGVFTFTFVRALWRDFWPIFFVHKGKPTNMLL